MKKLSRKTVEEALDMLGLQVVIDRKAFEFGLILFKDSGVVNIDGRHLYLSHLGIQLEPEIPEISIQNLGKFMALFGGTDEPYPDAEFIDSEDDEYYGSLNSINGLSFIADDTAYYSECKITDPRWPCIEHDSCELCEGVRS